MFSHVMVGSNDIERSKRFYDALLGLLGAGEPIRNVSSGGHVRLFYRHDGSTFCVTQPINGEPASHANGGTIGFRCQSPEQVQQFHDVAVAHGGTSIEDAPGLRQGSLGPMYLACAIRTATSSARSIARVERDSVRGRRMDGFGVDAVDVFLPVSPGFLGARSNIGATGCARSIAAAPASETPRSSEDCIDRLRRPCPDASARRRVGGRPMPPTRRTAAAPQR